MRKVLEPNHLVEEIHEPQQCAARGHDVVD